MFTCFFNSSAPLQLCFWDSFILIYVTWVTHLYGYSWYELFSLGIHFLTKGKLEYFYFFTTVNLLSWSPGMSVEIGYMPKELPGGEVCISATLPSTVTLLSYLHSHWKYMRVSISLNAWYYQSWKFLLNFLIWTKISM